MYTRMIKLLIIADDFTGALDTGVQFAMSGVCTRVFTDPACDFSRVDERVSVAVVDAETRHLSAARAYDIVYNLTRQAVSLGVSHIFKKTDSGLRGNIGAELTAVMTAAGCDQLPFLPAFPQMNRTTRGGVHYIAGTPVSDSVFGIDPFEPVRHSAVTEIIAEQSGAGAHSSPALTGAQDIPQAQGIIVFDAQSEEDLASTARILHDAGRLRVMAGCAGLGAVVPALLGLSSGEKPQMPKLDPRLLVLCGSVNPVTLAQLSEAEHSGFVRLRLRPDQKLMEGYFDTPEGEAYLEAWKKKLARYDAVIIDANDEPDNEATAAYAREHGLSTEDLRVQISRTFGEVMGKLFDCPDVGTLLITGGDTLLQCMNCVGVYEMEPIGEMASGVVLSRFTLNGCTRFVISKSGGFGRSTLLADIRNQIKGQ